MKQRDRGFSLLELMVTITVVGILLGLAVPSFRQFSRNNAVTAAQNDLVTALNVARSEALRRNRPVSVCATADGLTCGTAADWARGWMAFTDRGAAGTIDTDDAALQIWQSPNTTLTFNSSGATFVRYLPTGMSAATATLDVSYTGCAGLYKRRISVTASGAVAGTLVACP